MSDIQYPFLYTQGQAPHLRVCPKHFRTNSKAYVLALDVLFVDTKMMFRIFSISECGATEQAADHIISQCPTHRALQGISGLMVLNDKARCWLNILAVSI